MKIVILDGKTINPGDLSWDPYREFGQVTYHERCPEGHEIEYIGDAEIAMLSKTKLSRETLGACHNLKFIGEMATGYDNIDINAATELGIAVCNVPAYSTESVAQHTIALILEITNQVGHYTRDLAAGKWDTSEDFCYWDRPLISLAGKSLGIIGYGSIGKRVAEIAKAIGMTINIYSRDAEAAVKSDIVSLHCPATEKNFQMINQSFINNMKDGAILINTARGKLLEEGAVADALKSGKLMAAGLDVLQKEPSLPDNPLLKLDNCYATPHLAWSPKDMRQRIIDICHDNLRAWKQGEKLNRIN